MLFLHLQHSSASSSGGPGWAAYCRLRAAGSTAMHRAGYRASERERVCCSSHAGVCTPSAADELVAALVRGGRASEEEALLRGDRHTREMRVTRECTSSGLWTVDCGLLRAAHAHALLLLPLMPDGPACVMAMGIVPLSSNGVCPYIRTYIYMVSTIRFMYGHLSTSHTNTYTHASRRLPPGLTRTRVHQCGVIHQTRKRLTDIVIVR